MLRCIFPHLGLATGKKHIGQLFPVLMDSIPKQSLHDFVTFNCIMTGSDILRLRGHDHQAYTPPVSSAPTSRTRVRWFAAFEVRDYLIQRSRFIYTRSGLCGPRYSPISVVVCRRSRSIQTYGKPLACKPQTQTWRTAGESESVWLTLSKMAIPQRHPTSIPGI